MEPISCSSGKDWLINWLILTHFNILKCEGFGNPPLIHELKSYFNSCIYFYFEIYLYFFKIVIIHHTLPMQDNKYLFYLFVFIFIPFLHFFIPFLSFILFLIVCQHPESQLLCGFYSKWLQLCGSFPCTQYCVINCHNQFISPTGRPQPHSS